MRPFIFFCLGIIALTTCTSLASAQTSIGFAQPDSLQNLLGYRLPDWGYRTWDASFGLDGMGQDNRRDEVRSYNNQVSTDLGSNLFRYRESERTSHQVQLRLNGNYYHQSQDTNSFDSTEHSLSGQALFNAGGRRYLGDGLLSVVGGLGENAQYRELEATRRDTNGTEEINRYSRNLNQQYAAGLGYGRIRNVIPLLRASRLSERLTALGRQPLSNQEIELVARYLATEGGYRLVYDRPDRFFWQDVLQPLLDEDKPLTPYEMLYLTEILQEDLGQRFTGWQGSVRYRFEQSTGEIYGTDSNQRTRTIEAGLDWYRNLSLDHQVSLRTSYAYGWRNNGPTASQLALLWASLDHLWSLADRHLWTSHISYEEQRLLDEDFRDRRLNLTSRLTTYLENRLSLETSVQLSRHWSDQPRYDARGWYWRYTVGLAWHLDRVLF